MSRLEKFPPLYEKTLWRKTYATQKISAGKNFFDKLSVIIDALCSGRKIFCDAKPLTSCRLEYDLAADKYLLIVYRERQSVFEKITVETLGALTLSEEFIPPECDKLLKKFYSENIAEVSLKVWNTRNALERCFALLYSRPNN